MQRPDQTQSFPGDASWKLLNQILPSPCGPSQHLHTMHSCFHTIMIWKWLQCDVLINLLVSTWKAAIGWETWLRASCSTALLQSVKFTPLPKFNINLISLPFLLARPPWTSTSLLALSTLSSISFQSSFSRSNKRDMSSTLPATYFSSVLHSIQLYLSTMTGI